MKTLLFLMALAAIAFVWTRDRLAAANLRAELAALVPQNADLSTVRRDHERLRQELAEASRRSAEWLQTTPTPAVPVTATPPPATLIGGEWQAPARWQNRGRATPAATIETALWAAAGGDLAGLQGLLYLDDAVRAKAEALRASLPETSRGVYPSAEHLLAAFATKSLPLGDAQLVWNHQPNDEEAWACLFVKNPEQVPAPFAADPPAPLPANREAAIARAAALKEARAKEKSPPTASPHDATRALYLTLRRRDDGWRLAVSPGAVEKIARELREGK